MISRKTRIKAEPEQEPEQELEQKKEKKHRIRVMPAHLKILQIYKVTRKRLNSRKRDNEKYDDLVTRLIDQYIAGRH